MRTHTYLGSEGTFVAWLEMMEECGYISVRATSSAIAVWLELYKVTKGTLQPPTNEGGDADGSIALRFEHGVHQLTCFINAEGFVAWEYVGLETTWRHYPKKREKPVPLPRVVYDVIEIIG